NDPGAAIISAGGNITDADITLPMMANISAGGTITNFNYTGQNAGSGDVTRIAASGDIVFGYGANSSGETIQVGGPGYVVVQAGGSIDLGYSLGIQATGNYSNQYALSAGETGASLVVAAGVRNSLNPGDVSAAFVSLETAGTDWLNLKSGSETAAAAAA